MLWAVGCSEEVCVLCVQFNILINSAMYTSRPHIIIKMLLTIIIYDYRWDREGKCIKERQEEEIEIDK